MERRECACRQTIVTWASAVFRSVVKNLITTDAWEPNWINAFKTHLSLKPNKHKRKSTALKSKCGISDWGRAAVLMSALSVVWYPVLPTRPLCVLGHIAEAVTWHGPLLVGPRLRCVLLNYEKMGFAWKPHWASLRGTFCSHGWAADHCLCLRGLLTRARVPPWSEIISALLPIHSLPQVQFLFFFFQIQTNLQQLCVANYARFTGNWVFSPMFAVGSSFLLPDIQSCFVF